jgi:hypothetical protein
LIKACITNLTQAQCGSTNLIAWDAEGSKAWGTKSAVTYSSGALQAFLGNLYCSNGVQNVDVTTLKTLTEAAALSPNPQALPILVRN